MEFQIDVAHVVFQLQLFSPRRVEAPPGGEATYLAVWGGARVMLSERCSQTGLGSQKMDDSHKPALQIQRY